MSELFHYGKKRRSGRYKYGSGENPFQHESWFLNRVSDLKDKGYTESQIVKELELKSTNELRAKVSIERNELDKLNIETANKLYSEGLSKTEISELMGRNESTVRNWINNDTRKMNANLSDIVENTLKDAVDKDTYIDVTSGVEKWLGSTQTRMDTVVAKMELEGYTVHKIYVDQPGAPGKKTTIKVLAPPGTTTSEIYENMSNIKVPFNNPGKLEGVRTKLNLAGKPVSVDSKRIKINYAEDGGTEKDGVIELRRGVDDISLGGALYAQVRIAVDGTHYLKGMAIYKDDMPDGIDIIYNSNKSKGTPKEKVFKPMKGLEKGDINWDNPFGATIKDPDAMFMTQRFYTDTDGKVHQSALNIVNEEGDWTKWSKTLASQMLSKQPLQLVKKQLNISYDVKMSEYEDIKKINNPVVKKNLLEQFADDCDSSAGHLKAAGMPRQASYAILPVNSLKSNEIYAPKYNDGETVVLIRYPHAGRFEIPELIVNNRNREGRRILKTSEGRDAMDAVGINSATAAKLSGADFDGDTVLVIPNNSKEIKSKPMLKQLEGFTEKMGDLYTLPQDAPDIPDSTKQAEMGRVSNLITDMTIKGANDDEIARAVKHSMVVIDCVKHRLDYEKSAQDNDIASLKRVYQGGDRAGASTLISKAGSEAHPYERKEGVLITDPKTGKTKRQYVDPDTGEKLYTYTDRTAVFRTLTVPVLDSEGNQVRKKNNRLATEKKSVYENKKTGELYYKNQDGSVHILSKDEKSKVKIKEQKITTDSTLMDETKNAMKLSSGTQIEDAYGEYANKLKALANMARKESISTPHQIYSPDSAKKYSKEVSSLKAKLNEAEKNAPIERQAILLANQTIRDQINKNPGMSKEEKKRLKGQAIASSRVSVGAKKKRVDPTDEEWKAIQEGAVSESLLKRILLNSDQDRIKELATPRSEKVKMTPQKLQLARSMQKNGYTLSEIASYLGVSASFVEKSLISN